MTRPAESPDGFLKMQPALFTPTGWLVLRMTICFSMSDRMARGSSSASFTRHLATIRSSPKDE
jgi:hypothetical protein